MTWFAEIRDGLRLLEEYKTDSVVAEWLTLDTQVLGGSKGLQQHLRIHDQALKA